MTWRQHWFPAVGGRQDAVADISFRIMAERRRQRKEGGSLARIMVCGLDLGKKEMRISNKQAELNLSPLFKLKSSKRSVF